MSFKIVLLAVLLPGQAAGLPGVQVGAHFFISFVGNRVTFYDYEIIKSNSLKDFKGWG